jgi:polyhydroxybutyrate depolymerase
MLSRKITAAAVVAAAIAAAPAQADARPRCVTAGAAGVPYQPGVNCRTVDVDGVDRRYVVYVPQRRPVTGDRAPVVLMFHGSSGTGEQFLRTSGWREQADATGLVAVFPTGLRYRVLESGRRVTKWSSFDLPGKIDPDERPPGYPEDAPMPADDVGFTDAILADLRARLPIDRHRIYASGFSNGANFAARLSIDRSDVFAAAGYSAGGLDTAHEPDRPVPTSITAGTRDGRILEGTGLPELPLEPVAMLTTPVLDAFFEMNTSTFGLDRNLLGIIARPRSTTLRWPATGSGPDGAVLQFRMIGGLRHTYPGAQAFARFFRAHRLP